MVDGHGPPPRAAFPHAQSSSPRRAGTLSVLTPSKARARAEALQEWIAETVVLADHMPADVKHSVVLFLQVAGGRTRPASAAGRPATARRLMLA